MEWKASGRLTRFEYARQAPTLKTTLERMQKILESKQAMRRRLAALPFSDKVKLLEQLRDRDLMLASSPLKRRGDVVKKSGQR